MQFREGLKDVEVLEGGAVTLRCVLSSVAAPVEWRRGEEILCPGGKYSLRQEGPVLELVVRNLRPQDSGQYSCHFGDQVTLATLTVNGKHPPTPSSSPGAHSGSSEMTVSPNLFAAQPAEFVGRLRSKESVEGDTAVMRCELSREAPVEWKKGLEILRAGNRLSLRQDGTVCELQIQGLVLEDAGEYSCVCGQERTSATLTIRGKDREGYMEH